MRPQMRNLTKEQIVYLDEHFCKHGQRYLAHYNCYLKERDNPKIQEKVAYFDLEASNLKADFGVVLCWVLRCPKPKRKIVCSIKPHELRTCLDKRVMEDLIKVLPSFDRIIGHYSSRFDIPFLRSRAEYHGLQFPEHKALWQTDTWRIARDKFCLSSNRLGNLASLLGIKEKKTPITTEHWIGALTGNQSNLDYIVRHCELDTLILEKVHQRIAKYSPRGKVSI